jgi:hypothetical protein
MDCIVLQSPRRQLKLYGFDSTWCRVNVDFRTILVPVLMATGVVGRDCDRQSKNRRELESPAHCSRRMRKAFRGNVGPPFRWASGW